MYLSIHKLLLMAAMKNPRNACISTYGDHKLGEYDSTPYLYLVILKGRVFACKAVSRMNAIDIASMSHELGDIMENESLSHGRPLNRYQIPNMEVVRIRPYHRGWWLGTNEKGVMENHIYVTLNNNKPTVYNEESVVLNFASTKGIIHKVRVHDSENDLKMKYMV